VEGRIQTLIRERSTATEDEIAWQVVREMSVQAAALLKPVFDEQKGKNGRLSIQTDPRLFRDSDAMVKQAIEFDRLAPNMIVKIPATKAGIVAIEEATYRGSALMRRYVYAAAMCGGGGSVERGLNRREQEGKEIATMGPVCTIMWAGSMTGLKF